MWDRFGKICDVTLADQVHFELKWEQLDPKESVDVEIRKGPLWLFGSAERIRDNRLYKNRKRMKMWRDVDIGKKQDLFYDQINRMVSQGL